MKMREMNDWKISNDTLKLGVELGRGSFGIVMAAEWRHTPVALKILFADAQAEDKVLFEKEVRMMATLHQRGAARFVLFPRFRIPDARPRAARTSSSSSATRGRPP